MAAAQSKPLTIAQRAIRARVCPACHWKQPADGAWPDTSRGRPCERGCTVFINLPMLMRIAHNVDSPEMGAYEAAINELVCQSCQSSPTSGDFCADGATRSCPLSRYAGDIVDVLERAERAWRKGK